MCILDLFLLCLGPLMRHTSTTLTIYWNIRTVSIWVHCTMWCPYLVDHNLFLLRGFCFPRIPDLFPGNGGKQVYRSFHPTVSLKETCLLINTVHWILRVWNMSTVQSFNYWGSWVINSGAIFLEIIHSSAHFPFIVNVNL